MQLPSYNYPIEEMEMFKRDFEEPLFIDPLTAENEADEFPVFYNLPRTDRKNFGYFNNNNNQMFQFNGGENPFENLPIDLRSIPDTVETEELSPPSQKEFLGPIVVGPQTKSTQTSSAKKV
uniref:Uncharacterized protein n=1 Tax=Panagrolaimus sp. ES5 TaxID=591445 RepID=A0AC34FZZ3_9BILA